MQMQGSPLSPRARRVIGRLMRGPAVLDRRGLRWALRVLSPAPVVVLVHHGRRSGRIYKTPVEVIDEEPGGRIVVSPMFGRRSAWYRNVTAGGLVEVHRGASAEVVGWRELDAAERREALSRYRERHPLYSRLILRMLVRANGLDGDPFDAVAREIPMLSLG
jgi:deazaflavin-dependent oxidoreductase (nitroreductase family)